MPKIKLLTENYFSVNCVYSWVILYCRNSFKFINFYSNFCCDIFDHIIFKMQVHRYLSSITSNIAYSLSLSSKILFGTGGLRLINYKQKMLYILMDF